MTVIQVFFFILKRFLDINSQKDSYSPCVSVFSDLKGEGGTKRLLAGGDGSADPGTLVTFHLHIPCTLKVPLGRQKTCSIIVSIINVSNSVHHLPNIRGGQFSVRSRVQGN